MILSTQDQKKEKNKDEKSNSTPKNIKSEGSIPASNKTNIISINGANKENNFFNSSELIYRKIKTDNNKNYIYSSKIEDDSEIEFLLGELKQCNMKKINNSNPIKSQLIHNTFFSEIATNNTNNTNNKQLIITEENLEDNEIRQRKHKKKPEKHQTLKSKRTSERKSSRHHENIFQNNILRNKNFNLPFKTIHKISIKKNKLGSLKIKGLFKNDIRPKSKDSELNNRNLNFQKVNHSKKLKKIINIRVSNNSSTFLTHFSQKLSFINNNSLRSRTNTNKNSINRNPIKDNNISKIEKKNNNITTKKKIGENYIRFTDYNNEKNYNVKTNIVSRNKNPKAKKYNFKIISLEDRLFDNYSHYDRCNTDNYCSYLSRVIHKMNNSQSPKIKTRQKPNGKKKSENLINIFDYTKKYPDINICKREDSMKKNWRQIYKKKTELFIKRNKLNITKSDCFKKIPTVKINL